MDASDKSKDCTDIIDSIRTQCLARGISGIKGLGVLFRRLDTDFSKAVILREFVDGLTQYGIQLPTDALHRVFQYLDKNHSGSVDFREFLLELAAPMPQCRVDVVNEAFDKMDVNRDGSIQMDDLKITYHEHAERHPKYVSGEWDLETVLRTFIDTFDNPKERDGVVTREEFLTYYTGVSCTIDDDCYFDLLMRSSWGLPEKRTATRGT